MMATSIATLSSTSESPVVRLLRRYPLTAFFLLTYALTWPYMIVDALGSHGVLPFRLRMLLRRLLIWRVGWPWYALALFGSVILSAITIILYGLLTGILPELPMLSGQLLLTAPVLFVIGGLVNGEEIGWRGFALPRLLAKHNALN